MLSAKRGSKIEPTFFGKQGRRSNHWEGGRRLGQVVLKDPRFESQCDLNRSEADCLLFIGASVASEIRA